MAREIIPQEPPIGKDWEERLYYEGCAWMQQEAQQKLKEVGLVAVHPSTAWLAGRGVLGTDDSLPVCGWCRPRRKRRPRRSRRR